MTRFVNLFLILMFTSFFMQGADISASQLLNDQFQAQKELDYSARVLKSHMQAHPDIKLNAVMLPHSTRLDRSKFDVLSPEKQRLHVKRRELYAQYVQSKGLVAARRLAVEQAVMKELCGNSVQEIADVELKLQIDQAWHETGCLPLNSVLLQEPYYTMMREERFSVLRQLAEEDARARRARVAQEAIAQAACNYDSMCLPSRNVAHELLSVWK